jgi:hypothetical protein
MLHSFTPIALLTRNILLCIGVKLQRNTSPPKFGTVLVNTADADHARDIHERRFITSSTHLLNGVEITWKYKKQVFTTLHSTGSEITALTSGVKKTNHLHELLSSLIYPVGAPAPILKITKEQSNPFELHAFMTTLSTWPPKFRGSTNNILRALSS